MLIDVSKLKRPPKPKKTVEKHYHTYERSRSNLEVYRCLDPECTHFNRKEFLEGKKARCKCGDLFILSYEQLKNKTPVCSNCSKAKPKPKVAPSLVLSIQEELNKLV
jgi:formylmethanofuran dehydrogenase subunit E